MNIYAAELIDGENISYKWASTVHSILDAEVQRGVSLVARIFVGNQHAQSSWTTVIQSSSFKVKSHQGGKDAADSLLEAEALKLARQGVNRFYLLSNDRYFARLATMLRHDGCQVIGFGTENATTQWQEACDLFVCLDREIGASAAQVAALASPEGDFMSHFASEINVCVTPEQKRDALKLFYPSERPLSSLAILLDRLLAHTLTALCEADGFEQEYASSWSAREEAEMLAIGAQDPLLSFLLEQDASVMQHWEMVQAFAQRCAEAYEQGYGEALKAYPAFPGQKFHALHQEHLAHLLAHWQYDVYSGRAEAQKMYPGYSVSSERGAMERWFRHGYVSGALEGGQAWSKRKRSQSAVST